MLPEDRDRARRGAHASIAGEAADEVIAALIAQFSDPYAFVRELIQNSLDAGAGRIDVRMAWADQVLTVEVIDDGEGMDRATIEGYLLVKFRSSKEHDLTKIGKFGIGFVSLFAMRPTEVEVDTGRDGVWHRVRFAADMQWTLIEMEEPLEGTTVRLRLPRTRAEASADCVKLRASAERWCRFADGEVWTEAVGVPNGWGSAPIRAVFDVEAPLRVELVRDGVRAVAGPWPETHAPVGLYNRGLTLWEGSSDALPGVTYRVEGRHLEHTLTRDNVIRDRHYLQVMEAVRALATGPLGDAVHEALRVHAARADLAPLTALIAALHPRPPWRWREDLPFLPAHGRGPVSLGELRGGVLARLRSGPLWCAAVEGPAAAQLAGDRVVLRGGPTDPAPAFAAAVLGRPIRDVSDSFVAAALIDPEPAWRALLDAVRSVGQPLGWREVGVARLGGPVAVGLAALGKPQPVDRPAATAIVLGVDHPLWAAALALDPGLGAPILARGAALACGPACRLPEADEVASALLRALPPAGGAR